jgi:hypothetical protein
MIDPQGYLHCAPWQKHMEAWVQLQPRQASVANRCIAHSQPMAMKTLLAVLKAVGMKLSVEPDQHATA